MAKLEIPILPVSIRIFSSMEDPDNRKIARDSSTLDLSFITPPCELDLFLYSSLNDLRGYECRYG